MGLEKELENERMDYEEEFKTGEPKSSWKYFFYGFYKDGKML